MPGLWDKLFPIKCDSDTSSASWQSSFELTFTSDGVESLSLKFTLEVIEESAGRYNLLPRFHGIMGLTFANRKPKRVYPSLQQILLRAGN